MRIIGWLVGTALICGALNYQDAHAQNPPKFTAWGPSIGIQSYPHHCTFYPEINFALLRRVRHQVFSANISYSSLWPVKPRDRTFYQSDYSFSTYRVIYSHTGNFQLSYGFYLERKSISFSGSLSAEIGIEYNKMHSTYYSDYRTSTHTGTNHSPRGLLGSSFSTYKQTGKNSLLYITTGTHLVPTFALPFRYTLGFLRKF